MILVPTLASVEALYRKLERESYRAFHSRSAIHKADHFFNFCVTAHSMRDYFLERVGKVRGSDRDPFEAQWRAEPLLVAAAEIANSTKHFMLRERGTGLPRKPSTRHVRLKKNLFVDIYTNEHGEIKAVPVAAPDIATTVSDGRGYDLYEYTGEVLSYWRSFLASYGIRIRRQSVRQLIGKRGRGT